MNTSSFGIVITSPINTYYNTTTHWFNVTSNIGASYCNYSIDGAAYILMSNDSTTHWYNNSTVLEGGHTATFECAGPFGDTASDFVYFTIDLTKPNIQFEAPTTSGNVSQSNIEYTKMVNDTNFASTTVYLYGSTGLIENITSTSLTQYRNFFPLPDGVYYLNATAIDLAGNMNKTDTIKIMLDTTLPTLQFEIPTTFGNNSQRP